MYRWAIDIQRLERFKVITAGGQWGRGVMTGYLHLFITRFVVVVFKLGIIDLNIYYFRCPGRVIHSLYYKVSIYGIKSVSIWFGLKRQDITSILESVDYLCSFKYWSKQIFHKRHIYIVLRQRPNEIFIMVRNSMSNLTLSPILRNSKLFEPWNIMKMRGIWNPASRELVCTEFIIARLSEIQPLNPGMANYLCAAEMLQGLGWKLNKRLK